MYGDNVCNDFVEIIAGTNNTVTKSYLEAKSIANDNNKSMKYLKKMITTIEVLSTKKGIKEQKISSSKGNLKQFSDYENIKIIIDFLKQNLGSVKYVKDIIRLYDDILKYQSQYTEGYEKNNQLVILEYEGAVYLLITATVAVMNNNIDFVQNGNKIKIQKKANDESKLILKLVHDLLKEIDNEKHHKYLETILRKDSFNESVFTEGTVGDILSLISDVFDNGFKMGVHLRRVFISIKNSIFGIVPIIRSILYLKYKKKADMIAALDEKVFFIKMNIEQLENRTNIDPKEKEKIIKRQKAYIDKYQKKSEKLRAKLIETERDTEEAIRKNNEEISKSSEDDDDDFILESGLSEFFESLKKEEIDKNSYKRIIEIIGDHKIADEIERDLLNNPKRFLMDPKNKNEITQCCGSLYKDGDSVESYIYDIIVYRLSKHNFVAYFDWKVSLDDFIHVMKKCISKRNIASVEMNKDQLMKFQKVNDWVKLLNQEWESKKVMIVEINRGDCDSYTLLPCNIEDFNKLTDYTKTKFKFNEFGKIKNSKNESNNEIKMPDEIYKRYHEYDDIEKEFKVKIPSSIKIGYALKANVLYRNGNNDISADILTPSRIKSEYKIINNDINSKADGESYKKYLPVIPIVAIGNGDFDVIDKNNHIMYYSHDGKTTLVQNTNNISADPEKFLFVDDPHAKYDKNSNKTIYID